MACPICSAPGDPAFRPFCSKRCADLDLARWLSGAYAIPSDEPDDLFEIEEAMAQVRDEPPAKPH